MTFFPPPAFPFSGLILKLELGVQTLGSCGPQLEFLSAYTCSDCFGLIPVPVQPDPGLRMFQLTNILWGPSKRKSKIWTNQFISNLISQNLSQMPVSISALCLYALLIIEIWIFLWYLRLLYCFEAHRLKSLSWNFIKILIKIWYI